MNQAPTVHRLLRRKSTIAIAGYAASLATASSAARIGVPRRTSTASAQDEQRSANRPGLVPRHACGDDCETGGARPARRAAIEPVRGQRHRKQRRSEQQRLGHRRALQIEDVRIREQQRRTRRAGDDRSGPADDHRRERPRADRHREHRDGDRRRPGAIPRVHLNRDHVEDVREWKPHGTDLLPPGHQAVEDAARDDEVGARVVVGQREVRARVVDGCRGAGNQRCDGNRHGRPAAPTFVLPGVVVVVSGFSRTFSSRMLVGWIRRGGQNVF